MQAWIVWWWRRPHGWTKAATYPRRRQAVKFLQQNPGLGLLIRAEQAGPPPAPRAQEVRTE